MADIVKKTENNQIIEKIEIHDISSFEKDPDVIAFINEADVKLGENGSFILKLSGIPFENMILLQGEEEEQCRDLLWDFRELLIKKGYIKTTSFQRKKVGINREVEKTEEGYIIHSSSDFYYDFIISPDGLKDDRRACSDV